MHASRLFEHTVDLLQQVLRFDAPADGIVSAYFRRHHELGPRERHALAETVYALLRRRLLYQHLAQSGRGRLERRLAALAWHGEPGVLARAMDAQEQAWLAQVRLVDIESLPEPARHNLPPWIADPLREQIGDEEFWPLALALQGAAPLDLRVNTLKLDREAARASLGQAGIVTAPTPYSPWGLRAAGKPAIQACDAFRRGEVEVQDEGSQLLALLTGARRGEMVVDFCAGAGGKTLALGAMMRSTGRLYAFDVSASRLAALRPRLRRSGLSNVYPAQISHERDERVKRLAGKIDRVLVDAPCSGLGTLRRNPDLKWRQSPRTVEELTAKQRAILDAAARLPKPGGWLIYATCSLLEVENEAVASDFGARHPEFDPVSVADILRRARVEDPERLTRGSWLRLWPHRHDTDGFYAAVWQRRSA